MFQMSNQIKLVMFISSFLLSPVFSWYIYLHNYRLINLPSSTTMDDIPVFQLIYNIIPKMIVIHDQVPHNQAEVLLLHLQNTAYIKSPYITKNSYQEKEIG